MLLLLLLDLTDFYVRYHAINLLRLLLQNQPKQLQASILESRLGVSRLVDLLDDAREIIRNGWGARDGALRQGGRADPSLTFSTRLPPAASVRFRSQRAFCS